MRVPTLIGKTKPACIGCASVPYDLCGRLARREEKRSLKTKDAAEAKRSLLQALSALETGSLVDRNRR